MDTAGDTETDSVLKGVVRAERLETPEDFIDDIVKLVRREHIAAQYKLPKDGEGTWTTSLDLMERISRRAGRLLKGGEPCLRSAAIYLINDFQRGKLPHFVAPPELKEDADVKSKSRATLPGIKGVEQNLDDIESIDKKKKGKKEGKGKDGNDDAVSDNEE